MMSPPSRLDVADHQAQQRRFARARAAEDDQRFAFEDVEADRVEDGSAVEVLVTSRTWMAASGTF